MKAVPHRRTFPDEAIKVNFMEQISPSITPTDLYARLGTASAPAIVDVRRPADFAKSGELIISAFHRPPDDVERWRADLPSECQVVVHCVHGREVSQRVAATLRSAGVDAIYLQGGIDGWIAQRACRRTGR
jgi:rhodanese-related sulfurtransferase